MKIFLLAAGATCLAGPAAAKNNPGEGLSGTKMAMMRGTCSLLVVGGKDLTSQCKPTLMNNAYRSGRSSFMFGVGDAVMVSFFGVDSQAVGDQATLAVDEIGIATGHADGTARRIPHAVRGSCTYSNPYRGASRVSCVADGSDGHYAVEFLSDGQPPNVIELP